MSLCGLTITELSMSIVVDVLLTLCRSDRIDIVPSQDYIHVKLPITMAESLLTVKYLKFTHTYSGLTIWRTLDHYSVPMEVSSDIDFIGKNSLRL